MYKFTLCSIACALKYTLSGVHQCKDTITGEKEIHARARNRQVNKTTPVLHFIGQTETHNHCVKWKLSREESGGGSTERVALKFYLEK